MAVEIRWDYALPNFRSRFSKIALEKLKQDAETARLEAKELVFLLAHSVSLSTDDWL